jgi:hypothetical protein
MRYSRINHTMTTVSTMAIAAMTYIKISMASGVFLAMARARLEEDSKLKLRPVYPVRRGSMYTGFTYFTGPV